MYENYETTKMTPEEEAGNAYLSNKVHKLVRAVVPTKALSMVIWIEPIDGKPGAFHRNAIWDTYDDWPAHMIGAANDVVRALHQQNRAITPAREDEKTFLRVADLLERFQRLAPWERAHFKSLMDVVDTVDPQSLSTPEAVCGVEPKPEIPSDPQA